MSVSSGTPIEVAKAASIASRAIAVLPAQDRNDALAAIHDALSTAKDTILAANARDVAAAVQAASAGTLSQSVLKRLDLTKPGKWEDMLQGILDVKKLEDPVFSRLIQRSCVTIGMEWSTPYGKLNFPFQGPAGESTVGQVTLRTRLDQGLELERVTCPIGVLLIIFEARPEVIANIASLAIKSGNAAILKGGKESTESFVAISTVISQALEKTAVPNAAIQLVKTRDVIPELLKLDKHVDLVIPRGSNELVSYIKNNTKIPVLGHADGLCSIYIREDADKEMAVKILLDAKLGYTAACNAVETLLVDEAALTTVIPAVAAALLEKGVSLRCDESSRASLSTSLSQSQSALLQAAVDSDFDTEFLDLILAVKTVPKAPGGAVESVDLAIAHINAHGSKHTDAIITSDESLARRFQAGVDGACVFWNASTRMADGMRFGFGTEVGVSTNKIHARGPVGLEGLMIYKYLIKGSGQTAGEYGEGGKKWLHEKLPF